MTMRHFSSTLLVAGWVTTLLIMLAGGLFCIPAEAIAQSANPTQFVPLTNLPGIDYTSTASFVNGFIRILFVVAALLAIGMILWGGFLYLTTESVSGKGDARGKISDALIGLMLLLISVLILSIINPDILNIRLFRTSGTTPRAPTSAPATSPQPPPPPAIDVSQPITIPSTVWDSDAGRAQAERFRESCRSQSGTMRREARIVGTDYSTILSCQR